MKDELLEVFDSRHLHQSIAEVSRDRFSNGDFWATILSAGAIVEKTVKEVLGSEGHLQNVMGYAFDGHSPRIRLAYDKEVHVGLAMIFKGMAKAIRNPKAHNPSFTQSDPVKTLEYLGLMSLLLRRIDERVSPRDTGAG